MNDIKFDWNDITIVPAVISEISSRSKVVARMSNNKLPIFTAPMDMVIDKNNVNLFDKDLNICLPRNVKWLDLENPNFFYSYGLDEIIDIYNKEEFLPKRVLIDIANGHIEKLLKFSKTLKENRDIELMVGNIANPETYRLYCKYGIDWIRVGVGAGSACITSANSSIHFPMASLVEECYEISKEFTNPTKIIADGGFRNYSDIIKALAVGADAVMIGGILSKCLESCSDSYMLDGDSYYEIENQEECYKSGLSLYKYYRGMSTKEVQKSWGKKVLKTSEGISKFNKVEYTLSGWSENFEDYLKSTMSYCGKSNLNDFIGKVRYTLVTQNAFNRYNK